MYEEILALLIDKFKQARKDGLQQLARSMSLQVSEKTEAQALVDKIVDSQVTDFIKDWRKEVDSEVSKSTKTFEDNLKSKFDFVEKKTPTKPIVSEEKGSISALISKAVSEAVAPLQEKITSLETGKTSESRKQTLLGKLENAPTVFKDTVLKNFSRMNFESEEDFNSFLTETEADVKTAEQELANNGLNGFPRPNNSTSKKLGEEVDSDITGWAESNKE